MAHYDIFRHHLAIKYPAYGHALWEPSRGHSYPAPVEVGDIGFIREGRFHRLFNALLPAEDPSHRNYGVPEYHVQLRLRMEEHIIPSKLGPNNLCSARVTSQPVPRELAMGPDSPAEVVFSCGKKQGAVLSIPTEAKCENTVALGDFGEWMIKHIDSWFAWVRRLGVGIDKMEDIVLVTGTHCTRSWTNVAFPGGQVDGLVSFGANVATRGELVTINWKFSHEYTRGAVMNYGPHGEDLPEDQCLFIRGYRVARKLIFLPRGLKAAAGPNPDPKGDDSESDEELMSLQAVPEYGDPLHTLLEYVVEAAPNCDMALVHDDDLTQFSALGDDTSLEALQPDALLYHLKCLKPKVHDVLLGKDMSSRGSSANAGSKSFRIATLSTIFEGRSALPNAAEEAFTWGVTDATSSEIEGSGAVKMESAPPPEVLSCPVKGMYRLLDLIMEQGSHGLVDKIVVAQESFREFINALSPGAYFSITKINFKLLDDLLLKPIGVYGSKEEIVRFLREMGAVDVETARKLLVPERDYIARGAVPILRSGLYVVRTFTSTIKEQVYVLYWPGDTTWDDNAVSTVELIRVTFMRYLTKLCDQLVCLLSTKHSHAIVWGEDIRKNLKRENFQI